MPGISTCPFLFLSLRECYFSHFACSDCVLIRVFFFKKLLNVQALACLKSKGFRLFWGADFCLSFYFLVNVKSI